MESVSELIGARHQTKFTVYGLRLLVTRQWQHGGFLRMQEEGGLEDLALDGIWHFW